MQRTISIRLKTTKEQEAKLLSLQKAYHNACNDLIPYVIEHRCWNRVALHNIKNEQVLIM
jgi:predicted transposase